MKHQYPYTRSLERVPSPVFRGRAWCLWTPACCRCCSGPERMVCEADHERRRSSRTVTTWYRTRAVCVGLRRTVFVNTVLVDTIDLWWCDTSRTHTTARLRSWFARARFARASQTIRSGTVYRYMPLPRRQTPYSGNSLVYAPIMIESYFPPAYGLHRFLIKYHIFGFPSTFWAFWPKYIGLVRNIQGSSFL